MVVYNINTMAEITYNVSLKLTEEDGVVTSVRILKCKSSLNANILKQINSVLKEAFSVIEDDHTLKVNNDIEMVTNQFKTSADLGNLAERQILTYLLGISQTNSDFKVYDTSSTKGHGDIAVEYKNKRTCIEVKNYTSIIPKKEIEKFHNSVSFDDYDVGIMISMNEHGYAREYKINSPIDFKIVNGKPVAYLTNIDNQLIYPILMNLYESCSNKVDSCDIQKQLDSKIEALIQIHVKAMQLKKIIESQEKQISSMKSIIDEMYTISE